MRDWDKLIAAKREELEKQAMRTADIGRELQKLIDDADDEAQRRWNLEVGMGILPGVE